MLTITFNLKSGEKLSLGGEVLTKAESRVVVRRVEGKTHKKAAKALGGRSPSTVKNHLYSVYGKTFLTSSDRSLVVQVLKDYPNRFSLVFKDDKVPSYAGLVRKLTEKETDAMHFLCQGLSNKLIARQMGGISEHTVRNHLTSVYKKTGLGDDVKTIVVLSLLHDEQKRSAVLVAPGYDHMG